MLIIIDLMMLLYLIIDPSLSEEFYTFYHVDHYGPFCAALSYYWRISLPEEFKRAFTMLIIMDLIMLRYVIIDPFTARGLLIVFIMLIIMDFIMLRYHIIDPFTARGIL